MKKSKYNYNCIEAIDRKEAEIKGYLKELEAQKRKLLLESHDIYVNFYEMLTNKEFVYYDKFPSIQELKMFLAVNNVHPMYSYSMFNLEELAEIIKYTYQYHTGKEFKIFAYGLKRFDYQYVKDNIHSFYIAIGNTKTLEELTRYNGYITNYFDDFSSYMKASRKSASKKERIVIKPQECVRHYGDLETSRFDVSEYIISRNIEANIENSNYKSKGINNLFSFDIHPYDRYLANVLLSIIIYKKNNNIINLEENHYKEIFSKLFEDDIDMIADIKKDFGKKLGYTIHAKAE